LELRPVTRLTSAQSVAQQLLELIRTGTFKAGDVLPSEKQLAEQLGVGRSTIREALQNLSALSVVEASSGHRTIIKAPSPAELFRTDVIGFLIGDTLAQELLEAREMIEPECVRLAVERATDEELNEIDKLLDEHEARHQANQPVAEYGAMFHIRLAEASHNRVASSFMASILHLMKERGRRIDDVPNARRKEIDDHRRILALVKARRPDAADAMRHHILEWSDTYFVSSEQA
jgi:DNA-binding FadR family transcriptional regulator